MAERIRIPKLLSRSATMWLSVAVAVLAVPGVMAWAWLTQPIGNAVAGTVVGIALLAALVWMVGRGTSLDPDTGHLVREWWGRPGHRTALAEARVSLRGNQAGQLHLLVAEPGRRTPTRVPLVATDLGGERSQPPDVLRALADQLDTWTTGAGRVTGRLRAQADHLEAGGSVRESPLVRR